VLAERDELRARTTASRRSRGTIPFTPEMRLTDNSEATCVHANPLVKDEASQGSSRRVAWNHSKSVLHFVDGHPSFQSFTAASNDVALDGSATILYGRPSHRVRHDSNSVIG
jgi:hypothetical protein